MHIKDRILKLIQIHEFKKFSDKNISHYTVKGLELATSCVRDQDATTAPVTHMKDRILKLIQIHASVIYQIP